MAGLLLTDWYIRDAVVVLQRLHFGITLLSYLCLRPRSLRHHIRHVETGTLFLMLLGSQLHLGGPLLAHSLSLCFLFFLLCVFHLFADPLGCLFRVKFALHQADHLIREIVDVFFEFVVLAWARIIKDSRPRLQRNSIQTFRRRNRLPLMRLARLRPVRRMRLQVLRQ